MLASGCEASQGQNLGSMGSPGAAGHEEEWRVRHGLELGLLLGSHSLVRVGRDTVSRL